ncbi:hypothetical protein XENOCAPTIV_000060 [Xenoophorus captivus]|uniref:DUF3668 domain-containing protein n=1 Tax=Xenoophorus captivus TaxID=1517983 RepID=A0ABV0Q757_9TELE
MSTWLRSLTNFSSLCPFWKCFTLDSISKKKENVGYIVLDLRSVQEVRQEPRWYQLLSSRYTKQKPALLVATILENDSKATEPSPEKFKAKKAPPRQDFEPERASVRIRSSEQVLQAFLSQQPSLQIHLCCGNHSLGSTDVSLSALAAASVDLQDKAATVDGAFILQPPKRIKLPALPADLQPTVGVAVTLRREELAPQVDDTISALFRKIAEVLLPVYNQYVWFCRYSYQFFGSSGPIMTNPPVELQRNMEASLPQSYCAFDFAALPHQLQDTFLSQRDPGVGLLAGGYRCVRTWLCGSAWYYFNPPV